MKLSSLLTENQIIMEMRALEHAAAIEELVEHLYLNPNRKQIQTQSESKTNPNLKQIQI